MRRSLAARIFLPLGVEINTDDAIKKREKCNERHRSSKLSSCSWDIRKNSTKNSVRSADRDKYSIILPSIRRYYDRNTYSKPSFPVGADLQLRDRPPYRYVHLSFRVF